MHEITTSTHTQIMESCHFGGFLGSIVTFKTAFVNILVSMKMH